MSKAQCPKPKILQPKVVTSNSRLHESKIVRITELWTLDVGHWTVEALRGNRESRTASC